MYIALKHSHLLTAVLSLLLTVAWAFLAWNGGNAGPSGSKKATYIAHRAVAGLMGLTGLAVTFVGPWRLMLFPYVGLALFLVHGMAATMSRRVFASEHGATRRRVSLLVQMVALLLAFYLMRAKPF
ncbi:TPA: hypothetical protein ACGS08_002856 [Pseudomonas aeruginosa]|uniref:hypothetical protein n=1 Tax=Pseudomonas aeruginosa TaxID=287 RepID=UPI0037287345